MRGSFLVALVAVAVVSLAVRAEAACPAYPSNVPGWQGLTHAVVVRYVKDHFHGDWRRYQDALAKALQTVTEIRDTGGTAVIDGRRRLSGPALNRYIDLLTTRIDVTRCLASTQMASADSGTGSTSQVASFETAAGGAMTSNDTATTPAPATETAALPASRPVTDNTGNINLGGHLMHIDITTLCQQNQGILRIVNNGKAWPKIAQLVIRAANANVAKPVAVRVLRMVEGQSASFYVDPHQALNVSIKPSWPGGTPIQRDVPPSCGG